VLAYEDTFQKNSDVYKLCFCVPQMACNPELPITTKMRMNSVNFSHKHSGF